MKFDHLVGNPIEPRASKGPTTKPIRLIKSWTCGELYQAIAHELAPGRTMLFKIQPILTATPMRVYDGLVAEIVDVVNIGPCVTLRTGNIRRHRHKSIDEILERLGEQDPDLPVVCDSMDVISGEWLLHPVLPGLHIAQHSLWPHIPNHIRMGVGDSIRMHSLRRGTSLVRFDR